MGGIIKVAAFVIAGIELIVLLIVSEVVVAILTAIATLISIYLVGYALGLLEDVHTSMQWMEQDIRAIKEKVNQQTSSQQQKPAAPKAVAPYYGSKPTTTSGNGITCKECGLSNTATAFQCRSCGERLR